MIVHLIDGTYELFRHFYGLRRFTKGNDRKVCIWTPDRVEPPFQAKASEPFRRARSAEQLGEHGAKLVEPGHLGLSSRHPGKEAMKRLFSCQLLFLLLAGMAAAAQDATTNPGEGPTNPTEPKPEITVTGKVPHAEAPLPKLAPDEFTDCNADGPRGVDVLDPVQLVLCNAKRNAEMHVVIEACVNPGGSKPLPRVIQACTELLDRKLFVGRDRFPLFVNRARAYFAGGDNQRALADYNEAVRVAPYNAKAYYSRGAFYAAQSDDDDALRDFDAALGRDSKAVPALHMRAKLFQAQGNFSRAVEDYSEAIRLQPKTAGLWSERGYVRLRQKDNEGALKDEAQAIHLDSKLARAYFLRGAAFGGLGDSANAVTDLVKAVDLDPSLDRYVTTKGKTASLTLPPF